MHNLQPPNIVDLSEFKGVFATRRLKWRQNLWEAIKGKSLSFRFRKSPFEVSPTHESQTNAVQPKQLRDNGTKQSPQETSVNRNRREGRPAMYFEAILSCAIIAITTVTCVVGILVWQKRKNDKLRENIQSGKFIEANEFLKEWRYQSGRVGYKYNDVSGCYIIQIFSNPPTDEEQQYENVYIGQSVRACERVRNHLTGHGNGDVYADAKYGKYIRIQIVPCEKNMLNNLEKDLISAFNATDSYNKTKGGSKRRH